MPIVIERVMACHRKFVVPLSRNPTIVESRNRLRTKGGLAVASPSWETMGTNDCSLSIFRATLCITTKRLVAGRTEQETLLTCLGHHTKFRASSALPGDLTAGSRDLSFGPPRTRPHPPDSMCGLHKNCSTHYDKRSGNDRLSRP